MVLSGKRVFSETFRIVKERFGALLGIWGVYFGMQLALFAVFGLMIGSAVLSGFAGADPQQSPGAGLGAGMIIGVILFYLAYLLVIMAQYGAMTSAASPLQQPTFGDALKDGLRSAPTMLGVIVLLGIGYVIGAMVIGLISAALVAALGSAGGLVVGLAMLAAAIYMFSRLVVLLPVAAVERIGNPITVISRTWSLTAGNVFKIILINIVMIVMVVIVAGLAIAPAMGSFAELNQTIQSGGAPSFAGMGLTFLLMLVAGIIFAIFGAALQAAIHAELAGDSATNLDQTFA